MPKFIFSCFCLLLFLSSQAQERQPVYQLSQASPDLKAFTNCTIVLSPGQSLEDATLLIEDGIIKAVGKDIEIPAAAQIQDLKGYWIYPGLIDAFALYGQKVARARVSGPQFTSKREGPYHWNQAVKVHERLNEGFTPSAKENEALRKLGFTTAHLAARDGVFRAQGLVLHLGDTDPHEAILSENASIGLALNKGSSPQNYPNSLMGAVALIRQTLYDAQWYQQAVESRRQDQRQASFAQNLSLQAWNDAVARQTPIIFETRNFENTLRAIGLSKEFDLPFIFQTNGEEFRQLNKIKASGASFIIPLSYPDGYKIEDLADAREISLEQLRLWEFAPSNPARLANADISFAITTDGLKDLQRFHPNLRKAMAQGLTEAQALAALTTIPAQMLGLEEQIGTLEMGKSADFLICSGNLFGEANQIYEVYVAGERFENQARPQFNFIGDWQWQSDGERFQLNLSGKPESPKAKVYIGKAKEPIDANFKAEGNQFQLQFSQGESYYSIRGFLAGQQLSGYMEAPSGERSYLLAQSAQARKSSKSSVQSPSAPVVGILANSQVPYPLNGYGRLSIPEASSFVVRNATLWTNAGEGIIKGDLWVENGKIKALGSELDVPEGITSIDAQGKHLTTGIIDEHSHASITQGTNEGTHSVSAEVRVRDAINPGAINLYRQLAGGTTTSQLLHGSANPIGGQSAIIKLRWGQDVEGLLLEEQPDFIKFALGENVKRSNRSRQYNVRYPQTRMGVEQMIKDAFREAKAYRARWQDWEQNGQANNLIPPKRDLQLEALLQILDDERFITCHSYVQSEITMLMRLAEAEGFRVNTFTHILEGYKVADKMAAHGATGSTFSDWWAYKYEVIDAIPHNAALMQMAGVNVCINSDDREMARRLNQEAAKAVKYGGVSEEDAWKMVTLNAAKALHLDDRLGSMEVGKDADLVLWTDHPMSIYAKAERVWIDGAQYFDMAQDELMRKRIAAERQRILNAMRLKADGNSPSFPGRRIAPEYGCDDVGGLEDIY